MKIYSFVFALFVGAQVTASSSRGYARQERKISTTIIHASLIAFLVTESDAHFSLRALGIGSGTTDATASIGGSTTDATASIGSSTTDATVSIGTTDATESIGNTTDATTATLSKNPTTAPTQQTLVGFAGTVSTNEDCKFLNDVKREGFAEGMTETLTTFICPGRTSCSITVQMNCGLSTSTRFLSSRSLQSQAVWDVRYQAFFVLACGTNGCASVADTDTVNAIIENVESSVRTALSSGNFALILSNNPKFVSAFGVVTCFVAWGAIKVNDSPTIDTSGGTNTTANNLFYPDWKGRTGICINDGNEPLYMKMFPKWWLYDSLEGCCDKYYYGWNKPKCMNDGGSGLWFVDSILEKCVADCEEGAGGLCGGLAAPISDQLFGDPRSCCEAKLPWIFTDYCESESLGTNCYGGTGKYYRGDEVCVKDCDTTSSDASCGGVVIGSWVRLYDSASACCAAEVEWVENELCVTRSNVAAIDKYWPDQISGLCVKDSVTPTQDLSVQLFDTAEDCCAASIWWIFEATCVAASTGGAP